MSIYINPNIGHRYISLEFPLLHKCDDIKTILAIIENGFRYSYSKERISDNSKSVELSFPMISFSDLDGSTASRILGSYGQLGIGMTKDWAQKNSLTPVLYFESNANITSSLIEGFEILQNVTDDEIKSSLKGVLKGKHHKFYKFILEISSFSKNFYAPLYRKNKLLNEEYCFGSEREWRIILKESDVPLFFINDHDKDKFNAIANKYYLRFDFEDIYYFIVEAKDEEIKIKEKLMRNFNKTEIEISHIQFYYDTSRYDPNE